MKIAFLAGYNNIHTVRWVNSLSERGHDVVLLTLQKKGEILHPRVKKVLLPIPPPIGYYLNAPFIRHYLRRFQPDILHAHYASGYGTLGRLCNFSPFILSAWGSDVFNFPNVSSRNRRLIIRNLTSADMICSTSENMATVIKSLCGHRLPPISITPFGVDTDAFAADKSAKTKSELTVGTAKRLKHIYGIDVLIRSFALARDHFKEKNPAMAEQLRLLIVGDGEAKDELMLLANNQGIADITHFQGEVKYERVPAYLNGMDIFAALSRTESFGVAILEACSCELPVLVSDADGPCEVVVNNRTGIIVPREDVQATADALIRLLLDSELRRSLGKTGREHVIDRYSWRKSVDIMEDVYRKAVVQPV